MTRLPKFAIPLSLLVCAAAMRAQPNTTSKYLVLTTYHVKPAAIADFADFLKDKWMPAMKKGGATPRIYTATPVSGDASVFLIASYLDSLATFDNPVTALEKGAGAGGYARLQAQRAQMIDQRTQMVLTRQAEMSVYRETPAESPLLLLQYLKTAPGKSQEFRDAWVKTAVPAVKKAGRAVSTWRLAFGDETQFVVSVPLASFAELDKGHTAAQLTMEPTAYTAWNRSVQPLGDSTRREVLHLRRDLMGAE